MKNNKVLAILLGGSFGIEAIIGLLFLVAPKAFSTTAAVVVICLSVASGLILPNPVSFWFLIAGICMLVLPAWVVGICLLVLSAVGMVAVPLSYHK